MDLLVRRLVRSCADVVGVGVVSHLRRRVGRSKIGVPGHMPLR
jgi:hypothetical protein